jgi:protocatechuate 3,4-dioxygenase beta subunit
MAEHTRIEKVTEGLVAALATAVEDLQITEDELRAGLDYLTRVGKADEFQLLSDVLHLSVLVERITHGEEGEGLPANVEGPFYKPRAPMLDPPYALCPPDEPGEPLFVEIHIVSAGDGRPLSGALLDVWQANDAGFYDNQDPTLGEFNLRGRMRTGEDGTLEFRTVKPPPYEIPKDGPVGELLRLLGRHAFRPAHLHMKASADGHVPMTSMMYFEGDPWLESDSIDSVKPASVVALHLHESIDERNLGRPYATCRADIALRPARS